MSNRLELSLWFGFGVILQVVLLVQNRWTWKTALSCLGIGLLGMAPGKREHNYLEHIYIHVLIAFGAFAFGVAAHFRKYLLPRVNEIFVLSYTLTMWYAVFSYLRSPIAIEILVILFFFPTTATLFIAFSRTDLSIPWHVFFYVWFLVAVIVIGALQFPFRNLSFFVKDGFYWIAIPDLVFSGMAFTYLAVNLSHVWELMPVTRSKTQSWTERKLEIKQYIGLLNERYGKYQLTRQQVMLLLVCQGGILLVNYFYPFISKTLLVNAFVIAPFLVADMVEFETNSGNS